MSVKSLLKCGLNDERDLELNKPKDPYQDILLLHRNYHWFEFCENSKKLLSNLKHGISPFKAPHATYYNFETTMKHYGCDKSYVGVTT